MKMHEKMFGLDGLPAEFRVIGLNRLPGQIQNKEQRQKTNQTAKTNHSNFLILFYYTDFKGGLAGSRVAGSPDMTDIHTAGNMREIPAYFIVRQRDARSAESGDLFPGKVKNFNRHVRRPFEPVTDMV